MSVIIVSNILQAKEGFNLLIRGLWFFFSRKEREELSLSSVRETHLKLPVEEIRVPKYVCSRVQYQCSVFLCGILDRSFSLHVFERS